LYNTKNKKVSIWVVDDQKERELTLFFLLLKLKSLILFITRFFLEFDIIKALAKNNLNYVTGVAWLLPVRIARSLVNSS
jgi:hypothetical protein